jgi:hypothetical protein
MNKELISAGLKIVMLGILSILPSTIFLFFLPILFYIILIIEIVLVIIGICIFLTGVFSC